MVDVLLIEPEAVQRAARLCARPVVLVHDVRGAVATAPGDPAGTDRL
jgi:hypothetical protein